MAKNYFQMPGKGFWEGKSHSLKGYNFPAKSDKSLDVRGVIWFPIAICLRVTETKETLRPSNN